MDEQTNLHDELQKAIRMYKTSSLILLASIVAYIICLFFVKNTPVSIALAILMMVLAIWNTTCSRKISRLSAQKKQADKAAAAANGETGQLIEGQENLAEPIVANATSLNDLPKDYTVLDNVDVDGEIVPHIIVSPYGIAVVGNEDIKPALETMLHDLETESPIFFYSPDQSVDVLAESIQMPKEVKLDERTIYKILYRLSGLN